ncbi:MAG: flavodoxin-dependent (E)-4-hydroxy-3-methylbut-2-enyl-diphosphate synthase [Elusimicrobia bacterium]|nr:flavodoxin-dependent (E)-4-hydroxy-3-methylbut-2-enyl-diphosphate synthase [Elusimicrobiota bacterium]
MNKRRKTRQVKVGEVAIGSSHPVSVQSMTNTDTADIASTVAQIRELEKAGCQIVRVAVPDTAAAESIDKIKKAISIPLCADIHFDWRLALECVKRGADKIRINPGNIGDKNKVKEVALACKDKGIPIRIGVNSGSLKALKKNPSPKWSPYKWASIMAKEAMEQAEILDEFNFKDIIVSLKADDIERTILANEIFASKTDIPLHLGVTEAGTFVSGVVKSSIGIGTLLSKGIGDTIRVSLTENPSVQVRTAFEILKALKLAQYGPDIVSCPTCGRCQTDVSKAVHEIEERIYSEPSLRNKARGLKIAVMGCVVNGPGEAREADFGICGGKGKGVWIEKGKQIKVLGEKEWSNEIIRKIRNK